MAEAPIREATCGPGAYCLQCGYDLRESPRGGVCPECSLACTQSAWLWDEAGDRWRRRLRQGTILLIVGPVYIVLFNVWMYVAFSLLNWGWLYSRSVYLLLNTIFYGLMLVGVALATVPCPEAIRPELRDRARGAARILSLACLAGLVVVPLVQWWLRTIADGYWMADLEGPLAIINLLASLLPWTLGAAVWAAGWLLMRYLLSVASIFRAHGLRRHLSFSLHAILVYTAQAAIFQAAMTISLPKTSQPLITPDFDLTIWRVYIVLAWAVFVVSYIWALIALVRLTIRFRRPAPARAAVRGTAAAAASQSPPG